MPLTYHIEPHRNLVVVAGSESIALEDVLRLLNDLEADDVRGRNGIVDTVHLTDTSMTFDAIRRISDRVTQLDDLFQGTRWAVIAPGDVMFGVARMYETIRSGGTFEVRTFRSADDANLWVRPGPRSL